MKITANMRANFCNKRKLRNNSLKTLAMTVFVLRGRAHKSNNSVYKQNKFIITSWPLFSTFDNVTTAPKRKLDLLLDF